LFKNNNKFGERNHQLGYDNNAHAKEPILLAIQQQKLNHNCEALVLGFALHLKGDTKHSNESSINYKQAYVLYSSLERWLRRIYGLLHL